MLNEKFKVCFILVWMNVYLDFLNGINILFADDIHISEDEVSGQMTIVIFEMPEKVNDVIVYIYILL